MKFAYVPPSRFFGRSWWCYLRPRRLTLDLPDRPAIYRWLFWNFELPSVLTIGTKEEK